MAYESLGNADFLAGPTLAGADLTTRQYCFVSVDAANTVVLPASGAPALGVLQNAPAVGYPATIAKSGVSKVVAGAAVAVNDPVTTDATGRAIPAVAGNRRLGVARQAASAAGVVIAVALDKDGTA